MSVAEHSALKKIGYVLRFYRRSKGYTQHEMAIAIGVSLRNFQRIEVGDVEPKLETLNKIARFLELPVSALIRWTHHEHLNLHDLATSAERAEFRTLQKETLSAGSDLQFVEKMIAKDSALPMTTDLQCEIVGTDLMVSNELAQQMGVESSKLDLQKCSLIGSPVERWELVFRLNLKSIFIENLYLLPSGVRMYQSFHPDINPNPDYPRSRCYVRDVTARHDLAQWLKTQHKFGA